MADIKNKIWHKMRKAGLKISLLIFLSCFTILVNAQWYTYYGAKISVSCTYYGFSYWGVGIDNDKGLPASDECLSNCGKNPIFNLAAVSLDWTQKTSFTAFFRGTMDDNCGTEVLYENIQVGSSRIYYYRDIPCTDVQGVNYLWEFNIWPFYHYYPQLDLSDIINHDLSTNDNLVLTVPGIDNYLTTYSSEAPIGFQVALNDGNNNWEYRSSSVFHQTGSNTGTISYADIVGSHTDWLGDNKELKIRVVQTIGGGGYPSPSAKFFIFHKPLDIIISDIMPSCPDVATGSFKVDLGASAMKDGTGKYPFVITLFSCTNDCSGCTDDNCLKNCRFQVKKQIIDYSDNTSYTATNIRGGAYIVMVTNGTFSYPDYKYQFIGTQTPTASILYRDDYPNVTPLYHVRNCDTYGYLQAKYITNGETPLRFTYNTSSEATDNGSQLFELPKSYTGHFTLRDFRGCVINTNGGDSTIEFKPTPPITFNLDRASSKNISCIGYSDGEIHYSYEGGYGLTHTIWVNSTSKSVPNSGINYQATGLLAGDYGVYVSDEAGCTIPEDIYAPENITLSQPSSALTAAVSPSDKTPPSCNASSDGSIILSASDGWGSYQYKLSGGIDQTGAAISGKDYQSGPTIIDLVGGTYNFTVKDGGGCETNVNGVSLAPPTALSIVPSGKLPASCSSAANGEVNIAMSGGSDTKNYTITGPKSYSGSFATSISLPLNDLPVGNFSISLTDAHVCSKIEIFTIDSVPNRISISPIISMIDSATCKQMRDGIVNITINGGGKPVKDYSLQTPTGWRSFTTGKDTAIVRRLSAGINTISVKDAVGCIASTTYDMPLKATHFQIESTPYDAACNKSFTGKLYVNRKTGTGASGNITFMFNDTNKLANDDAWYYKLQPGTYLVKAKDTNLCRDSVSFTILPSPAALKINKTIVRDAACANNPTGIIKVQKNTGTGIGDITFYTPDSSKTNTSQAFFYKLTPNTYTIKAYDNVGCRDSIDAQISISPNTLQLSSYVLNDAACTKSPSGRIVASSLVNKSKTGWGPVMFKVGVQQISSRDTAILVKLEPGTYNVTAEDSVHCTASQSLPIAALPNPVYFKSAVSSPQSCNEIVNGKVGVGAITSSTIKKFVFKNYTLNTTSDWKDTVLYNHIIGNAYTIRAIDTNRCYRDTIISIGNLHNNPKPYLQSKGYDSLACASAPNGAIRLGITQSVRKPAYTLFIKNNPQYVPTDSTFKGLKYVKDSIIVIDAVGCRGGEKFETPILKNSIKFRSGPSVTNASCAKAGNGIIKVGASNGLPYVTNKYKYKISRGDSTIDTTATFKNLDAKKTYQITVSDSMNCDNVIDIPIGVINDSLRLRLPIPKDATCSEKLTGIVVATRINGTPRKNGYAFTIVDSNKQPVKTGLQLASDSTINFKGLGKGQYSVAVADSNNCSVSQPFTIGFTPLFSTNGSIVTRVKRFGKPEGQIKSVINDGNGRFVYQLFKKENPIAALPLKQDTIKNNLMIIDKVYGGNYILKIKDTANCIYDTDEWMEDTLWVQQPEKALALKVVDQLNVKCFGDSSAWVKLRAEGGYPAYKFAINDTNNFVKDSIFINLKKGSYKLYVRDSERIDTLTEVGITQPLMPLNAITKDALSTKCYNYADGIAKLCIKGGTSPYFISLDSALWISDSTLTGLKAKTYKVLVHDSQNCLTRVYGLKINQPDSIMVASQSITNTPCLKNEGSINVTQVNGGNGNYLYAWYKNNAPQGSQAQVANLYSGRYTLSITDTYGCKGDTAFFISDLSSLQIDTILTIPVSCWGGSDGQAELKIRSGAQPFTITWPGKTAQLSQFTTGGLTRGTHNVYVVDGQSCNSSFLFNVGSFEDISIPETWISSPLCLGNNNGSIKVKATGGKADYSYNWGSYGSGDEAKKLSPGSYTVTVTDANNCIKPFNFSLAYTKVEKPNLGNDLLLCKQSDYVLNPKGYVSYNWTINNKQVSTDPVMVVREAGRYTVDVESSEGCLGSDTVNVAFTAEALLADFLLTTKAYAGDTIMLVEISRPLPDSVTWTLASAGKLIDQGTYYKQIALPDTGTYEFSMIAYYKGCADMVKKYVQVVNLDGNGSSKKSAKADLIQSVSLYPNPTSGQFSADIQLSRKADIFMRIVNLGTGTTELMRTSKGGNFYTERFNLHLVTGFYVLYIQAENESRTVNLVVR